MKQYYLGVDLGGTTIKAGLFDADFTCLSERRAPTGAADPAEEILHRMLVCVRDLADEAGGLAHIRAMGTGVPGQLDLAAGRVRFSPNFAHFEDVPVVDWFAERLGMPVFMENDVRTHLYGEWQFGAGRGRRSLLMVALGTGLGAGVVVDGRMLTGASDSAGELGHMNMYREGRPCRCGSQGCLGRYVSGLGIARTLREKIEGGQPSVVAEWLDGELDGLTAEMVSRAAHAGDAAAQETLKEAGELLGFALASALNLLNPECVIVGGGVAEAGDLLLTHTRHIVATRALRPARQACPIVRAELGAGAGMLGAAVHAAWRMGAYSLRTE